MDRLVREHDGFFRTSGGYAAVVPKMASGTTADGIKWFTFRPSPYGEEVRIEWDQDSPIALFDNDTAVLLIRNGYGTIPNEVAVHEYNKLADTATVVDKFPPDGWTPHPTSAGYYYKGQEVLTEADLRLRAK